MLTLLLLLAAQAAPPPTTVFFVRHAEKAAGDNPPLTEQGLQRAADLARALHHVPLSAVFSTDLCRTAQTVGPTAAQHGLSVQVVPLSGSELTACEPAIGAPLAPLPKADDAAADLVARLRALPPGSTALVVGHSNTVPELLVGLGVPPLCPDTFAFDEKGQCWLPHESFDNLFVVTVPKRGPAGWLHLRYGAP
jgi:phosphohistidine phosphatase SixA